MWMWAAEVLLACLSIAYLIYFVREVIKIFF